MSKLAELIAEALVCPHCGSPTPPARNNEKTVCPCRRSKDPMRKEPALDEDLDWSNVT
jgi:hypothetical protein